MSSFTTTSATGTSSATSSTTTDVRKPRTFFIYEPQGSNILTARRIISIAFSYDASGKVTYGSSIYRKVNDDERCCKAKILSTALIRFNKYPNTFTVPVNTSEKLKFNEIVSTIRKKMHTLGVKQKKHESTWHQICDKHTISTDTGKIVTHTDIH